MDRPHMFVEEAREVRVLGGPVRELQVLGVDDNLRERAEPDDKVDAAQHEEVVLRSEWALRRQLAPRSRQRRDAVQPVLSC